MALLRSLYLGIGESVIGENAVALVIEKDDQLRGRISGILRQVGFVVHEECSGRKGAARAFIDRPQLVVVGFGLSDIDGVATIRRLSVKLESRILAVLDPSTEIDVVLALDAGADAYTPKPLRDGEFRALVDALTRRQIRTQKTRKASKALQDHSLVHGALTLDSSTWEVRLEGEPVTLTATEFALLQVLMRAPGRVRSKKDLARMVTLNHDDSGYVTDADVRSIEVHIANLRRKLGDSARTAQWIETVRGVGYRLVNDKS